MTHNSEQQSTAVPMLADLVEATPVRQRWSWVKPWVWTDRMLTALEADQVGSVKGAKWFSLIDKVFADVTLFSAARRVTADRKKAAGVDHVTPEFFERDLLTHVSKAASELREGTYQPSAVRRTLIAKPGSKEQRPLGIPTVRDRMVQTALKDVIEPIFERGFAEHSYGFRPGRGCHDALRRVDQLLKAGYVYVVDADLKSYFDTIPHDRLMARIREKIADGKVLTLIERYLQQDVMAGLERWTPDAGSPQGAVISPLLSNIYLDPLDHLMAERGFEMVRYADDFVILCRSSEEAAAALALVQQWTSENGLTLHPEKTCVVSAETDGFDFLGYHFKHGDRFPRAKSQHRLEDSIREKTKRCNGHSLPVIIRRVNATLRGWFGYFKHVTKRFVFDDLDRFVRQRLRAILKKRKVKKSRPGYPKGKDLSQRWPNSYFANLGLFSLSAAHAKVVQPSLR